MRYNTPVGGEIMKIYEAISLQMIDGSDISLLVLQYRGAGNDTGGACREFCVQLKSSATFCIF